MPQDDGLSEDLSKQRGGNAVGFEVPTNKDIGRRSIALLKATAEKLTEVWRRPWDISVGIDRFGPAEREPTTQIA